MSLLECFLAALLEGLDEELARLSSLDRASSFISLTEIVLCFQCKH